MPQFVGIARALNGNIVRDLNSLHITCHISHRSYLHCYMYTRSNGSERLDTGLSVSPTEVPSALKLRCLVLRFAVGISHIEQTTQ